MNIKIGCTGWSYLGWSGTFYPKNLTSSDWLKYYSKIFDTTEINSTFYKIPTQEIVRKWNADTLHDTLDLLPNFPLLLRTKRG